MTTSATAILLIALGGALAQSQTPGPAERARGDSATTAVTGCLRRGAETGAYEIGNATWSSKVASEPSQGHHADAPEREKRPPLGTLRLAGAIDRLNLAEHVGHTVSAVGMLGADDPIVAPGVVLPDPPKRGDTTARTPSSAAAGGRRAVLNVRSVTRVADGCKE